MSLIRVVDLKQYAYCPRIMFYYYCWPDIRPITYKMEAGIEAQAEEAVREARRSLRVYGLRRGEIEANIELESTALGLRGTVDMVIRTDDNQAGQPELIPVDYKLSRQARGQHFQLQLAAYGLLLEAETGGSSQRGFLYSIPERRAGEVVFSQRLRAKLRRTVADIQAIIQTEIMPPPTRQRAKCYTCEFRRFCNDVV